MGDFANLPALPASAAAAAETPAVAAGSTSVGGGDAGVAGPTAGGVGPTVVGGSEVRAMSVDTEAEARHEGAPAAKVSFQEEPGMRAVCVRYAKPDAWVQRVVYISADCNSDDLKWALRNHTQGTVSTWRVHDGWRGKPYDRFRPIVQGPNYCTPGEELRAPLVIAPSFGP